MTVGATIVGATIVGAIIVGATMVGVTTVGRTGRGGIMDIIGEKPARKDIPKGIPIGAAKGDARPTAVGGRKGITAGEVDGVGGVKVMRPGSAMAAAGVITAFPNQPVKPVEVGGAPATPPAVGGAPATPPAVGGAPSQPPKVGMAGIVPKRPVPPKVGAPSPPKVGIIGFKKPKPDASPPKAGRVGIRAAGNPGVDVVVGVVPGRGGVKYITELKPGIGHCACAVEEIKKLKHKNKLPIAKSILRLDGFFIEIPLNLF
jgi:hypothetical protein